MKECLRKSCGKKFEPNKPKQVFCSAKCRVYHSRELKKEEPVIVSDFSRPNLVLSAKEQPKSNYSINTTKKEIPSGLDIPPMPVREDYEEGFNGSVDFAAAKNEWKRKYNQ